MKSVSKHLIVAGMLACMGFAASAQSTTPAAPPAGPARHEHMRPDPAKMAEFVAKRQAALKQKLQITPAQEGAWAAYTAATKPPADWGKRPDRAAIAKMTTPERIDRMRAMRAERAAAMDKRADATKTFYAALSPEQQKTFDANAMMRHHGPHHGGPRKG